MHTKAYRNLKNQKGPRNGTEKFQKMQKKDRGKGKSQKSDRSGDHKVANK